LQRKTGEKEYLTGARVSRTLAALICKQCGETYYTPETHDLVLRLVKAGARPVRTETLSVLDANAA
jgi:YgiT-type zinc finger domain-containing protein